VVYSKCADATQRLRKCLRESLPDNLSLVIAWAAQAQMLFSAEQVGDLGFRGLGFRVLGFLG
jgi:hypothetical protein